jgi:hypothetical protein
VPYAAIPRCTAAGSAEADTTTQAISHEVMEAATNPYGSGYTYVDDEHSPWAIGMGGGEVADLCNLRGSYWRPSSIGYAIARAWSNAAALAHKNPCDPGPAGEAYFNAFIAPKDRFPSNDAPNAPSVGGVRVVVGDTSTVDVLLYSDRQTSGPWDVSVQEVPMVARSPLALDLALDRTSGVNGEKVHLTITAKRSVSGGVTMVRITSKLGPQEARWFTPVSVR